MQSGLCGVLCMQWQPGTSLCFGVPCDSQCRWGVDATGQLRQRRHTLWEASMPGLICTCGAGQHDVPSLPVPFLQVAYLPLQTQAPLKQPAGLQPSALPACGLHLMRYGFQFRPGLSEQALLARRTTHEPEEAPCLTGGPAAAAQAACACCAMAPCTPTSWAWRQCWQMALS